jgi:acetate kinase
MDDQRDDLRTIKAFTDVTDQDFDALRENGRVVSYEPGDSILTFGDPGRVVGALVQGTAAVERVLDDGERVRLGSLERGDLFGEMSLLTGEPTSADIVASEPCRVVCWTHSFFRAFIARAPSVTLFLAQVLTNRLRARQLDDDDQLRVRQARRAQRDPYGFEVTDGPRRILVLNCGSSSLKYDVIDLGDVSKRRRGMIEPIGSAEAVHSYSAGQEQKRESTAVASHAAAIRLVLAGLGKASGIEAVGHRVVHGGEHYSGAAVIDAALIDTVRDMVRLAPLHNPANLAGIEACRELLPGVPQVAVFDTAFHQTMPQHAYTYALPTRYYEEQGIRRYGFHGTSHHYVALQAAVHMKRRLQELKLITCHLGNGASVCAVEHGRSIDTSMGLTPLEGLVMGTRCGDIDPALVIHLQRVEKLSPDEVDTLLNRKSGLLGLTGTSGDMRKTLEAAESGDRRAQLAIQVYCYRVKKYVGAYVAALGGLDALVFTAGVGENSRGVRARICQGLAYLGVSIDQRKNDRAVGLAPDQVADIAEDSSPVRVLVVPTDEQRMIAWETARALSLADIDVALAARAHMPVPIEVSAHHVHLQPEHVHILFGPGHELTVRSELSQPGQFACQETVDLVGPRGEVQKVRVLGPTRPETQVEISRTEEYKLGIDAPIRASGDLKGSPGLVLRGSRGSVKIKEGAICAMRHIHMSPEDALTYGLRDRDFVRIKVAGERPLSFGGVLVRVHPQYRLSMHIDTDEANAAELNTGMSGFIEAVEERV